jgi:hypothetical protein
MVRDDDFNNSSFLDSLHQHGGEDCEKEEDSVVIKKLQKRIIALESLQADLLEKIRDDELEKKGLKDRLDQCLKRE